MLYDVERTTFSCGMLFSLIGFSTHKRGVIKMSYYFFGVYYARLSGCSGTSIQSGNRPVIIVSKKSNSSLVSVIPLTSKEKKDMLTHVSLKVDCLQQNQRIPKDSTALVEQTIILPKKDLLKFYGRLKPEYARKIQEALKRHFGLK